MKTTNHTPIPWKLEIDTVYIRDGVTIQPLTHHMDAQGIADARLIAAAPDLLDALKALHFCHRGFAGSEDWTSLDDDAFDAARSAIAKAEGSEE